MRSPGVRVLMVAVGLAVFALYAGAAYLAYLLLRWLWLGRGDLATTLLLVAGLTLLFGYLSYQFGTERLLAGLDAAEIPRERAPGLYRRVERLAARADVGMPRLLVARMDAPNALALGSPSNGAIVVDAGLVRLLDSDELEGVLAHELAHLESHDGLVQTLAYSTVRTVVGLVMLVLLPVVLLVTGLNRALAWIRGRPLGVSRGGLRRGVDALVALVLVGLTLLVRAHSRRREYAADDRAVELTGDPLALARGVAAIDRASRPRGLLSTLYTHGGDDDRLTRLLSTHPAVDDRIERLVEMAEERGQVERPRKIEIR